ARDQINAPVRIVGKVVARACILMDECAVAPPVLPGAVGENDLGDAADRTLPLQQCRRVVWRSVARPERMSERRLGEAVVELAAPSAGDVTAHTVEHSAPVL